MTTMLQIHRPVRVKYTGDVEPPEIRARFGLMLLLAGVVLSLPAMSAGTIFSIGIATGQLTFWPAVGQGILIFGGLMALLGIWPLVAFVLGFGLRDASRWILLCLTVPGLAPAVVQGLLTVFTPDRVGVEIVQTQLAVAWMWVLPLLGLLLLRATGVGRPLPPLAAFIGMFRAGWRASIPGVQTGWGDVSSRSLMRDAVLRVPGGDFNIPDELRKLPLAPGDRMRVTYDLRAGRIETIEVAPTP